ncbi:hypothetical protein I553_5916 [Mycobacterium xenopi 4042]|uniref:Uncharacterized protein n=1 Tax=Mycobacterium xenopi 4042 TaxID=1299334 RepID=X8BD38_MYCXE|nr:hypothetical protein I553_5916 [Mycobacterium xenopi 4042]
MSLASVRQSGQAATAGGGKIRRRPPPRRLMMLTTDVRPDAGAKLTVVSDAAAGCGCIPVGFGSTQCGPPRSRTRSAR